jgi:hypothetical protein
MATRHQFNSYVLPRTTDLIKIESDRTSLSAGKIVDKAIALYSMADLSLFNRRLQEYLGETVEADIETLKRIRNFIDVYLASLERA